MTFHLCFLHNIRAGGSQKQILTFTKTSAIDTDYQQCEHENIVMTVTKDRRSKKGKLMKIGNLEKYTVGLDMAGL